MEDVIRFTDSEKALRKLLEDTLVNAAADLLQTAGALSKRDFTEDNNIKESLDDLRGVAKDIVFYIAQLNRGK